jgi:hypothetical protein
MHLIVDEQSGNGLGSSLQLVTHLQAADTSEYSLNGGLETAVRGCSARHEPDDTLGRLRVRLHRGGSLETGAFMCRSRQCSGVVAAVNEHKMSTPLLQEP